MSFQDEELILEPFQKANLYNFKKLHNLHHLSDEQILKTFWFARYELGVAFNDLFIEFKNISCNLIKKSNVIYKYFKK